MIVKNFSQDQIKVNRLFIVSALMQNKDNYLSVYNDLVIMDTLNPINRQTIAHKHFMFDNQGLLEQTEEFEADELERYNYMLNNPNKFYNDESEDFE